MLTRIITQYNKKNADLVYFPWPHVAINTCNAILSVVGTHSSPNGMVIG